MICSEDNESDTESTDAECTWGGLGAFEYSAKGLTHALVHAPEPVKTCVITEHVVLAWWKQDIKNS